MFGYLHCPTFEMVLLLVLLDISFPVTVFLWRNLDIAYPMCVMSNILIKPILQSTAYFGNELVAIWVTIDNGEVVITVLCWN